MLLALPLMAQAQDEAPKVEIFGGYSYLRTDDDLSTDQDLNGWNASFTTNISRWFGVTADFSGHYGNIPVTTGVNADFNTHLFTVGPRFAYRNFERVTPFGHVLFGAVRQDADFLTSTGRVSFNDSTFAMVVGGGVDLKITDNIAFRLFQTDYVLTRFNDDNQSNFRASTGVVIKLGEQ